MSAAGKHHWHSVGHCETPIGVWGKSLPVHKDSVKQGGDATNLIFFDSLDADPLTWDWEGYPALRDDLLQAWSDLGDLNDLPAAMIHTDVCFENTIQTATGEVVLIDWDDAGLAPALQDVGYFLVHEAIPSGDAVDWDRARAFLDGYQSERPLETREWDRLADALVFGALAYVLAPWESKIYHLNWQRLRCVRELGPRLVEGLRR